MGVRGAERGEPGPGGRGGDPMAGGKFPLPKMLREGRRKGKKNNNNNIKKKELEGTREVEEGKGEEEEEEGEKGGVGGW